MALPNINQQTFELEVPSTDEIVKYRPFLVKEEKVLLQAQESGKTKDQIKAIKTIIDNCTFGKIDVDTLPSFDLEYIFLNIRSKSVGETVKLKVRAPDDNETMVPVEVDLSKVNVHVDVDHTNKIELTKDAGLVMTYPTMDMFMDANLANPSTDEMLDVISKCILQIYNGEEVFDKASTSDKDRKDFIENLTQEQFLKLQHFFKTMPKLKHEVKVTNPKTKKKGTVVIEGLQSFF
tara:strand:- start:670 stop:1374 length:705 start_codon:yes stop_codon:yes gene_type:complete